MKRNNGIDLFRIIGAFFIVLIHSSYGNLSSEYVENIRLSARWVVPFFFMCTGFFLKKKIINGKLSFRDIEKNVSYLMSLLLISDVIYICVNKNLLVHLEVGVVLTGTYFHLWYIPSLIFGYLIIWYIYYIGASRVLPLISIAILAIALLFDSYDVLFGLKLNYEFMRFLISVPFIYIGLYLSNNNLSKESIPGIILFVLLGVICCYFEAKILYKHFHYSRFEHQMLLGIIIIAISLFLLSVNLSIGDNAFSNWGREYSLFVYMYHPLVQVFYYKIVNILIKIISLNLKDNLAIASPIIIFIMTLTLAIILNKHFSPVFRLLNGYLNNQDGLRS